MLGSDGAQALSADVGATVVLDRTRFDVVGIFRSGERWRDSGAIVPLETAQRIASKTDVVTAVHVTVVDSVDPHEVALAIEREHPQLAGLVPSVSSLLVPMYSPDVFARALAVGIIVGLMGALYPAIRAVRLSPMEATSV